MAICPFSVWREFEAPAGTYTQGPFRIIHHTTEGSRAEHAFAAYAKKRSQPHFTVDGTTIYQHVDTDQSARSLKNPSGGVETNRHSAVQIEVVGFAHLPKGAPTLQNVARLCRWIEETHNVSRIWPNGHPKVAVDGKDPGGHNRDADNWVNLGGHYGHCHVPENDHWDPGYTDEEVAYLMFTPAPSHLPSIASKALLDALPSVDQATLDAAISTMPDHPENDDED